MNITVKGIVKTVAVGVIAYGAGKLNTLTKLALVCKDKPDDIKEAINGACDFWQNFKEQTEDDADYEQEEETAPEIVQVTSAEDKETPEENQPED